MSKAFLVLEDGTIFEGKSFGAEGTTQGEIVFNTSMSGYQEIITDPASSGLLLTMTYPIIGNYGINKEDSESDKVQASGLIVKEYSRTYSNYRAYTSLGDFLKEHNVVAIEGIDTRKLVHIIREKGSMKAVISTDNSNIEELKKLAINTADIEGQDLVSKVTSSQKYEWTQGGWNIDTGFNQPENLEYNVVAIDLGVTKTALRNLVELGCRVTVVPAFTSIEEIKSLNPDGIFLSSGPGDPKALTNTIELVKEFIGKYPIFGIALGGQIIGLALGGKTSKLKTGHHGVNYPVKVEETGRVKITSQNCLFALEAKSLNEQVEITHINLNNKTVEGIKHKKYPVFAVQYIPEACPESYDSMLLLEKFIDLLKENKA